MPCLHRAAKSLFLLQLVNACDQILCPVILCVEVIIHALCLIDERLGVGIADFHASSTRSASWDSSLSRMS